MANGKWYAEHREYLREKSREWGRNNPEKKKAYMLKWRAENREKRNEQRRAHYRRNAQAILERQRRWRKENPEKAEILYRKNVLKAQRWRKNNPVMARTLWHRRRERVRTTLDKSAINILSQLISSAARLKCGICEKNMPKNDRTIDHIIPLAKGGTGDVWNLRIVHLRCNIQKAAKMPDELNFARDGAHPKNKNSGNTDSEATCEPHLKLPHLNAMQ
jgi:5-methylcytosine-specific restriction endonuclease McrA